ncbi:MAG: sucrose phosphorylase [Anaerolineaceae bacterium]|nr:sucrose phosphorylase [Anaerolineaceae bacterium]
MSLNNKVQLITYADSLGGDLAALNYVLEHHFKGLFQGGIHILPPFPSTGDRGFAPVSYFQIEPTFGSWKDIQTLTQNYPVMLDLMVNHISSSSEFFKDYLQNGVKSKFADMFLDAEKFWPGGEPAQADIDKIFLRRESPFSEFKVGPDHEVRKLWTTFGEGNPSDQVDVDVNSPITRDLFVKILRHFQENGIQYIRLDAVGYVVKKLGTSCFFVEPEIYAFMEWIKTAAREAEIELLPEVHAEFPIQKNLSDHGYWIYDFMLPYLILETLVKKDSRKLKDYLQVRPTRQFTMLDCHDGIPVKPDMNGYYDSDTVKEIVALCAERGGNMNRVISAEHQDPDGFDVHQIRGTYYSMLGNDDDAYYAARAIQLFTPGIPQVYYVGLLAGMNDQEAYARTGEGREINRHSYTLEEITQEMEREIVKRLMRLIQFRSEYSAFDGACTFASCTDKEVCIEWRKEDDFARLKLDLLSNRTTITYLDHASGQEAMLA